MAKKWYETLYTYLWIFNIGRGFSAFIRLPQNIGFICDMGSSDNFSPRKFIEDNIITKLNKFTDSYGKQRKIAQLIISHPHADHITEISSSNKDQQENRFIDAALITCPHAKEYPAELAKEYKDEKTDFTRITNQKDQKWLVDKYQNMIKDRNLPLQTISSKDVSVPNVDYGIYYVRPPSCNILYKNDDQKYSNSISFVYYLRHGNQNILIPGDITPEAFEKVLCCDSDVERRYTNFNSNIDSEDSKKNTGTQSKLGHILTKYGLSILVCPHHGLESGYCTKLYNYIAGGKPYLNIISERRHIGNSEGKIHQNYQSSNGAKGIDVDVKGKIEKRYSATTREGHILIVFKGTDIVPHVYLRDKPEDLLNIVP
jgi:hypothetical protein